MTEAEAIAEDAKLKAQGWKVVGHHKNQPCPLCKRDSFCDDCGLCENKPCGYAPPSVACSECKQEVEHDPQCPKSGQDIICAECGDGCLHERTCSVTLASIAN